MENGKKWTSIGLSVETKQALDEVCPKSYSYDDWILAMIKLFEKNKKSGVKVGESAQDHSTS